MENTEKIFIDGYHTSDIPETVPAFVLGRGSFHAKRLVAWLTENQKYADRNGFIPFETLRSREKQTRYTQVDMFQYQNSLKNREETPESREYNDTKYRNIDGTISGTSEASKNHPDESVQKANDEASDRLFNSQLTEEENRRLAEIPFN